MIKEVKADKTLLVNGPASVRLISGEAKIFDASLSIDETIVIRDGKRVPLYVEKEASFDIMHGEDETVEEADGDTIPASWHKTAEDILALGKTTVVIIMGKVDSGKTSLCTFLANSAIKANLAAAIIDADLGQSDIGPPTTIGLAYINKPVMDLFYVDVGNTDFVGLTSPSGVEEYVVNCIADFKKRALRGKRNFLLINTDGWVEGEEAVQYKVMLMEAIAPNAVVGIEREKELAPIVGKLVKNRVLTVEPSTAIKRRDRERRKTLRELSYKRYLRNAKVEGFPLKWAKIRGAHSSPSLFLTNGRLKRIEKTLGTQPIFCRETFETIWVALKQSQRLDFRRLHEAEEVLKKRIRVVQKGDEKGSVVGLHDEKNKFLGLGIIYNIDYRREVIEVYTPVTQKVATIQVGKVRLDNLCREINTNATFWS